MTFSWAHEARPVSNQLARDQSPSVTDGRTLAYEYTLHDPVYMTRPHTGRVDLTRVPDGTEIYRYECDLESTAMWSRSAADPPLRAAEPR